MPKANSLVSLSNNHIYWDGGYSRCHVGGSIEMYVRDAIQRFSFPVTAILTKRDGFMQGDDALFMYLESLRSPATYPIVGALCSRGFERTNLLYLPLDDDTFRDGLTNVLASIPRPTWEERKPVAFWRGGASGPERPLLRIRVAIELDGHPGTDVKITPWGGWEANHTIPSHLFAPRCGLEEHFQYKYILIVDGNCIASNHQWVFGSGSVPIMITHPENRYWFQKYLKPMVNYVPVKYDLSDLKEKIDWLREHDAEAKNIAENAMALSRDVFSSEFQRKYIDHALATIVLGTPSMLFHRHLQNTMTPSDINEHLTTLYEYTKKCNSVVECGVRNVVSSYSFASGLVGTPDNMYMLVDPFKSENIDPFLEVCHREGVNARFLMEDDTKCQPVETDMLFIDTWHVYGHLKRELAHWHSYVRKYIAMHDTTVDEIWGESVRMRMDVTRQSQESGYPEEEIRKGLGPAIVEFLETHPEWTVEKKYTHNNGLTILVRK